MNLTGNIRNQREERDSREKRDGSFGLKAEGFGTSNSELRVALFPLVLPVSHESDIEEQRRIRWNERE